MTKIPRIAFVNSYLEGRASDCERNAYPRSHLWGVNALIAEGFPVTILEREGSDIVSKWVGKLTRWTRGRFGDFAQELEILRKAREFDVIYVANGNIFWLLLFKRLGLLKSQLVTWFYTPPTQFPLWTLRNLADGRFLRDGWDGLLCLTDRTADYYKGKATRARVRKIDWGSDLRMFTGSSAEGRFFLTCGRTNRDYRTLISAAKQVDAPFRLVVSPHYLDGLELSENITVEAGPEDVGTDRGISYFDLIHNYYANARAVLIPRIDIRDDTSGFTNLLEAMAMGRPVIMTRTGCLDLDIEKEGIGFYVDPNDHEGWVKTLNYAWLNPIIMRETGARARHLAEKYYNTERFGRDIVAYFRTLVPENGISRYRAEPVVLQEAVK